MVSELIADRLLAVPAIWLRDNCECPECRDPSSRQKLFKVTDLPEHVSIGTVQSTDDGFVVSFLPDGHRSAFSNAWLASRSPSVNTGRSEDAKSLWRVGDLDHSTQHAQWSTYGADPVVRLGVLRSVARFGFALLHATPVQEGTVLQVAASFGFVRETNYGQLFDVRVEAIPNNLAFTGAAISPHTDNPYRDPVPTVQLLHCIANDVEGGESGLVDGFEAAATLRDEDPHAFEILASTPVTFAWGDTTTSLKAHRPMIELDPLGQIRAVRFNNRSLQTLRLEVERLPEYYDAYRNLARILDRPELMYQFRLDAGDCVIFDNTRILHARTAFDESSSGGRHLQGCYADLDGLESTIAILERESLNED
jgi:gamma-butyrobetaine dioxygenase